MERLLNIDHHKLVASADGELRNYDIESLRRGYAHFTGTSYTEQAKRFLAVSGPEDPRYNDLLRVLFLSGQNTDFDLMWNTLFSQNELNNKKTYPTTIKNFLDYMSRLSPWEQRVLTTGHIPVRDGYTQVGPQQLRLASYTHALPKTAGCYLILDCEKPVKSASDLIAGIRPVFENRETAQPFKLSSRELIKSAWPLINSSIDSAPRPASCTPLQKK